MTSSNSGFSAPPGLSLSTSTSALSSASSFSTPSNATHLNAEESLSALFEAAGLSPPEQAASIPKSFVVERAQGYFSSISKQWTDLNEIEKAKLAFLFLRRQDSRIYNQVSIESRGSTGDAITKKTAEHLWNVCKTDSDARFVKLNAYIRKGGDHSWGENNDFSSSALLENFSDFNSSEDQAKAVTLFQIPGKEGHLIEPLVRFQEDSSTICYIVSVVTAIYYSQCLQQDLTQGDGIKRYALNVNRFMRNYFTEDEIFVNIFCNQGGWPKNILQRLLQPFNVGNERLSRELPFAPMDDADAGVIFRTVKTSLKKYGALLVEKFLVFPEFAMDNGVLEFSGDWNNKEHYDDLRPHALLVVGARLTGDPSTMGGLALLLQNSWKAKPFVVVGYDLLKSMGIEDFIVVNEKLAFSTADCSLEGELSNSMMSGSPHWQNSNNIFFDRSDSNVHTPLSSTIVAEASVTRPLTDPYYWNIVKPDEKSANES